MKNALRKLACWFKGHDWKRIEVIPWPRGWGFVLDCQECARCHEQRNILRPGPTS